ncbi:FAD-dependent oxidoreductase [Fulvivirgaceae bacterium BMA12]|uniref:FAD-dependent oxidoreductase n=1 Tax=Agaribacillus aureus TaxID=3051825 RepID=A0ABT8LA91_9BACT|nr:FAD-dependent oxidoreductase [Fulvivirgaceae bacterium BMA12]
MDNNSGHHFIAIFGGAVAGSEAAYQLASRGFRVVVFDQNILPYGKIEDGLPKWHEKLRDKEENKINEKISHPNVHFVPGVQLGKDIDFVDVAKNWGFTAVLLATGAWRDRPIPVDGIDDYVDKGLYYQNPFVYWFNHYHEPTYNGPTYEIEDDAIVIGGGLASLDVVKILMIETVQRALEKKGIKTNMFQLERGINKVLEENDLTLDDLGLKGCTLFYRRRAIDMPLSSAPATTPEQLAKVQGVRQKILDNFLKKYLFKFEPCWSPAGTVVEDDRLTGITFQKNEITDGKVVPIPGVCETFKSSLFISSIGSIPEMIQGIPADGQVFKIDQDECCQLEGYDNVFALGNAVTGRGNIVESQKHSKAVSLALMDEHLHWQEEDYQAWLRGTESGIQQQLNVIVDRIERKKFMPEEVIQEILRKTKALQSKTGYDGDYNAWVKKNLPVRLEDMLD